MTENHVIQPRHEGDPKQLGGYSILGRIGRGGMGTVYLAETAAGERAAVKVINPDLADDDSFRDRFRREVESARRVRRFCTAPVLDAKLDGEPLFIVTEYVDGPDLDRFIRESGPMRGSSLEHLAVGVATALTAIHGAGVVHRDLKPANVLLSSVGPRVIDFGIARALDSLSQATRTGTFIGTPAYMAPELITGTAKASPASDVFAWGCIVAFAGTGHAPFEADTVPAVLYRVSHGEPMLDGLDPSLRELVASALAKDPQRRPSAQAILDRLTGRPHADTGQVAEDVRRTWAPPTREDAQMNGPAPTMMGGPPPAHPAGAGTRMFTQHPAASARRRRSLIIAAAAAGALILLAGGAFLLAGGSPPPENTSTVFADDFSKTASGWPGSTWISGSGYWQGGYRIDADSLETTRWETAPFKGALPSRLLVSADARVLTGPPNGQFAVWCRGTGNRANSQSYDFLVRADGKGVLIRKEAGASGSKTLVEKPSAPGYKKGTDNRLQAACEEDGGKVRLRMWINGELAAETTDADHPLSNGGAGLMTVRENGGSSGNMNVRFDDFDLSKIG